MAQTGFMIATVYMKLLKVTFKKCQAFWQNVIKDEKALLNITTLMLRKCFYNIRKYPKHMKSIITTNLYISSIR